MNRYIKDAGVLTCSLNGKIDTASSLILENEIAEQMKTDVHSVIVEMQDVNYISSTFLRILIKIVQNVGKQNFMVRNVQPPVMKVFKMANLTEMVQIV